MPITGLSRPWSCPDMSAQNARSHKMNGLGENLSEVRASSAALSRATFCPPTPESTAGNDVGSPVASNNTAAAGLAGFGSLHMSQSVQDLFGAAQADKQPKLAAILLQSSNAYAYREITAFAKVYSQLIRQPDLSEDARSTLNVLAQQYTDKILNDGLGEKSAFGPWTAKTDKQYQQRSQLEHKLATFANTHLAGDFLQLGSGFIAREVMPYIQTCIEQQLGKTLNEATSQRLHELVDKAAMQTFDALRSSCGRLIEERGVGVGKLARDLDTVATLPLLLRDILANLPKDVPQTAQPAANPDTSDVPAVAETRPGPASGQGQGGITINIGDIHIDKSKHIDNSRHINNRHSGARGKRPTPTPLAQNLNVRMNQKVNDNAMPTVTPGGGGKKTYASESQSSKPVQNNLVHETYGPAGELLKMEAEFSTAGGLLNAARGVAGNLSQSLDMTDSGTVHQSVGEGHQRRNDDNTLGDESSRRTESKPLPGQEREVTDASGTEAVNVAGGYARLKFRDNNLYTLPPQAYLRSTGGQIKPEHELIKAARSMLETDTNQPWAIRRDFEALRNKLLPGSDTDRSQVLRKLRNGQVDDALQRDINTLRDLLAEHPDLDRRRSAFVSFARTLIRESGLLPKGQQTNPLLVALLDGVAGTGEGKWNWREEAQRTQPLNSTSGVVLTADGLHLDPLHARKNHHAK